MPFRVKGFQGNKGDLQGSGVQSPRIATVTLRIAGCNLAGPSYNPPRPKTGGWDSGLRGLRAQIAVQGLGFRVWSLGFRVWGLRHAVGFLAALISTLQTDEGKGGDAGTP